MATTWPTEGSTSQIEKTIARFNPSEEIRLHAPDMIKVFDDISHFQIGLLKPPTDQTYGQKAFVPIFPFLYERLECGDIIMDREQFISLHI